MRRAPHLRAASLGCVVWAGAIGGCNAIFGITRGEAGGSGGACSMDDGDGTTSWMPVGQANLSAQTLHSPGSISGSYDSSTNVSELILGDAVSGFCDIGALVYFAGKPVAGMTYTVVGASTFADLLTFAKGPNVYVMAGGQVAIDGGCEPKVREFGAVAGSGQVTIDSVSGTRVAFTVSAVQLTGLMDAMFAGQGTLQLDIHAHADCFTSR